MQVRSLKLDAMTTVIQFPEWDTKPLTERVSEEVRALMGRHGVSQTALADELGMTQSALSKRLRGDTRWKLEEIEAVAKALQVHPAVLMGGYAATPPPQPPRPGGGEPDRAEALRRLAESKRPRRGATAGYLDRAA